MKTMLCLGGGVESVPIIRKVHEMGHRAVVADANPDALGMALTNLPVIASCYDAEAIRKAIKFTAVVGESRTLIHANGAVIGIDGVLCCAVDAPRVATKLRIEFGLPGMSEEAAYRSQDKWCQKKALRNADLRVPDFARVYAGPEKDTRTITAAWGNKSLNGWDLEMEFNRTVVKPNDNRGGRGVSLLPINPLPANLFSAAVRRAEECSPTRSVVCETFLDGPQLSTESLIDRGRTVWTGLALRNYDHLNQFAPYIIEDGCDAPYGNAEVHQQVSQLVERACAALGWYQDGAGTVKGDLVVHDGNLYIIELAARLSGGFLCSHILPAAYGVDFLRYAIQAALSEPLSPWPPAYDVPRFVSQRYVFPAPKDIGKQVAEVPNGQADWAQFRSWNLRPGQIVEPVTSHPKRWGQAIGVGKSPGAALRLAQWEVEDMKKGVLLA